MRMILCKSCGSNFLASKSSEPFRDKCQACGKIKNCYKYNISVEAEERNQVNDGNINS